MAHKTISELLMRRDAGHVRVNAVRTYPTESLSTPLARLGIKYDGERCREIDETEARRILSSAFFQDLAYGAELMMQPEAESLADFILRDVFPPGSRLLTNIVDFGPKMFRGSYGGTFLGADATFSVGVIAQTDSVVACVWVEDED